MNRSQGGNGSGDVGEIRGDRSRERGKEGSEEFAVIIGRQRQSARQRGREPKRERKSVQETERERDSLQMLKGVCLSWP